MSMRGFAAKIWGKDGGVLAKATGNLTKTGQATGPTRSVK
jgi:hypothetical protein